MVEEVPVKSLGKYEVIGTLGSGAMGAVYRGFDSDLGRHVALKTVRFDKTTPDLIARFRAEVQTVGQLHHRNIPTVFAAYFEHQPPFLVMEYLNGGSLAALIRKKGYLEPEVLIPYLKQAAEALDYAHARRILHRDIKPAHIFISGDGRVMVLDFGVALISSGFSTWEQQEGKPTLVGTPGYISPEQLTDDSPDTRTDVFSLAVVAFEGLTGSLPFPGSTTTEVMTNTLGGKRRSLSELRPSLPLALEAELEKALSNDRRQRPTTATALVEGLARAAHMSLEETSSNEQFKDFSGESESPSLNPSNASMALQRHWDAPEREQSARRKVLVWFVAGVAVGLILVGLLLVTGYL